jgi:alpha-mannosidase
MRNHTWVRPGLVLAAAAMLAIGYRYSRSPVQAAPDSDPKVIWSIGKTDNSSDEFALGAAKQILYDAAKSRPGKDWRQRQDAATQTAPVYKVNFALDAPPPAPLLAIDCYFLDTVPESIELTVNGKRGSFRVRPVAAQNIDERQANNIKYSRASLRMPIDAGYFRRGRNQIGISFTGDGGGIYYDALRLERSGAGDSKLSATVEPTIFFRRRGEQLREITNVVINHSAPLGNTGIALKVGGVAVSKQDSSDNHDFGERVIEVDAPALSAPAPYELRVNSTRFQGEFRPEKRWRIFAGFKIHNDIGYTDLQPHIQELDARNADGVIDIISRFPFYKFNLETSWLADNYLHARKAPRTRQLMALAAREQVGINAIYLNLMTGMCTGEELYRSLYFSKSLQRKYGVPLKFACLTDAPSHSWFVPTLLADAGIPGFANGSNQTRAPLLQHSNLNEDSPFYWEGPDGKRVLAWFARSYLQFTRIAGQPPSLDRMRRAIPQFLARYRRADYPVDAVLLYGLYTDNADIRDGDAAAVKQWNQAYEFPKIVPATDGDYYDYLAEHFSKKLPTFRGDAGSYWEDGAGSTAAETAINRNSQRLLPVAEMAAALATAFEPVQAYPAEEFRDAWKNVLFYDEHTWGANVSVRQPDRNFTTQQWEFKRAYAMRGSWAAKDLFYRSMNRLVQNVSIDGPSLFVFNPDLWPRSGTVRFELQPGQSIVDPISGKTVLEADSRERLGLHSASMLVANVPGLGYKTFSVRRARAKAIPERATRDSWEIESNSYRLVLDRKTGAIAHLIDKQLNRDLVDPNAPYKLNELLYVSGGEDSSILQSLATLKPAELQVTGQSDADVEENLGSSIRVRARARNVPSIETEINLYDTPKRVEIINRIRKDEVRSKEAVYFAFPFRVSPPELAYEIQNAWVHPNADQLPGACREWFTTQNVVMARDPGIAIAWATPDAPLITLTDINRGRWLKHLDVNNGYVFSYAMNNYWFTNYKASQGGNFTFRYFISSESKISDAGLARFGAETRAPLVAYDFYNTGNVHLQPVKKRMPLGEGSFFKIDAPNAQVAAFKGAEDGNGFVLRLRETAGQKGTARLASPVFPIARAFLTNGVEENLSPLRLNGNGVPIPLKPHEFTTVRLVFATRGAKY